MKNIGIEPLEENKVRQISSISLAFIGDGVYDLYIRSKLMEKHFNYNSNKLNKLKVDCVNATAQAEIAKQIMVELSDEELAVLKRGRNAKSSTIPKNAKVVDYRYATGLEALFGYLFLLGREKRLKVLFEKAWQIVM